jgi:uncharacterized protein (TIGR00299 family) protein
MGHEDPEHGHSHGDGHGHSHDHGHGHDHEHQPRRVLAKGAGKGKLLFLDAPSGLAGDMTIAALVDLGVPRDVLAEAWNALPVGGYHVHFSHKTVSGIVATHFDVHVSEQQPLRTFATIRELLARASLDDGVRARAVRTFERLAEAEASVHRMPKDEVHFHEVGAVDAIIDIVGAAAAIEHLGAEMVCSPLPMGRGHVKAAHGVLPLPPPAVVECLRGFPTYDAGIEMELVTPTGAAIIAANAARAERWPSMSPEEIGWGAGTADLADRPNVLRAVLGQKTLENARATHVVLEANLDDATGEIVAGAIETLLAAGALDAWAAPLTMKKGRPGVMLGVVCAAASADTLAAVMIRETPTLGVRRTEVCRTERPRRVIEVETAYGKLPVKVAEGPYGPPQIKPEYDACAAAAKAHGVPVRVVIAAALTAANGYAPAP